MHEGVDPQARNEHRMHPTSIEQKKNKEPMEMLMTKWRCGVGEGEDEGA